MFIVARLTATQRSTIAGNRESAGYQSWGMLLSTAWCPVLCELRDLCYRLAADKYFSLHLGHHATQCRRLAPWGAEANAGSGEAICTIGFFSFLAQSSLQRRHCDIDSFALISTPGRVRSLVCAREHICT